ncbi:FGGY family carbohydrate kinase [Salegentibacter sp. F188]|uniref:FGGY family carbohydrate kinase n=1 Tax=Autumnicola patrickiae TaxID=3075591 RepID=A0ABU3E302_9FLAO|nr:FGGY family carbohydrate kinase [Salegentibacter sp. F188]MDT0690383.1 FGGY family carbohydrate kinase [Salegentibacter sp. F188]
MYFLGIDLGSSSIKVSVLDADKGKIICAVTVPEFEMEISAPKFDWAEQNPDTWWGYVKEGLNEVSKKHNIDLKKVNGIGIAYQMHGLVLTDENLEPVRPSIIWCDSRAVEIGNDALEAIGKENCHRQILGSPGNFTASKLKWVKQNEPEVYAKAKYMMLPGDYIAAKLSGVPQTTTSGLSEAALWDFPKGKLALEVLEKMGLSEDYIPEIVPSFGHQAKVSKEIASELGLNPDAVITYRAGDQPNNALSLNVLNPGEIATTAGTSAVIYAVTDKDNYDEQNRVNTFLHVNNNEDQKRNGILGIINGSGILYQWLRKTISLGNDELISYELLNREAAKVPAGSDGLRFYPFGNGAERIFNNKKVNSGIENLNFNIHQPPHLIRSACEGIVFAMNYGFDVMKSLGTSGEVVRAGKGNLFLSPVFREIFCNTTQANLELYNTSGAEGAARGAAYGYGYFSNLDEAFGELEIVERIEPDKNLSSQYQEIYSEWKENIKIEKE